MAYRCGLETSLEIRHKRVGHLRTRLNHSGFKLSGGCPESHTGDPVAGPKDSGSCDKGPKETAGRKAEPNAVKTENSKENGPEVSVPQSKVSPQRIRSQSRSKDRKHNSKGQTWTMTSHSDLPSDVSVDTASHPGCWLIPVTVECVQTLALLDTGASVSMMGRPLYQKVQQVSCLRLQTQDTAQLEGLAVTWFPP